MESLAEKVCAQLAALDDLQLAGESELHATRILNWGGFVNHSFKVSVGELTFHVKLADDPDTLRGLERWRRLSGTLSGRFAAPVMRGWIEVPGTSLSGPVFDWIDGASPECLSQAVRFAATDLVAELHSDHELARQLAGMGDAVVSCATAYQSTFHERFVEDLQGIRAAPPPFLTSALLDWMGAEAAALLRRIAESRAFEEPANAPSHGDLWLNNLVLSPSGALHIIDWDDLALGDPMMDWAMLLGPAPTRVRLADVSYLPDRSFSSLARERFGFHVRASLLDWVIDPLADWVEAAGSEYRDLARASKRRVHEEALALYRASYD